MSWWENWKEFTEPLVQEYGQTVGEYLCKHNPDEPGFHRAKARYQQIYNYFNGNVPEEVQNAFVVDPHKDYVFENLQTHDWKQLYEKLCDVFHCDIQIAWRSPGEDKEQNIVLRFPGVLSPKGEQLIKRVAEFYRYVPNISGSTVKLEPEFAKKVDMNGTNGYAYHIVSLSDVEPKEKQRILDSIQKNGLRPRNGYLPPEKDKETGKREINHYRYFPSRVYVFWLDGYLAKTEEGRKEQFQPVLDMLNLDWDDCAIFSICTGGLPMNFYRDTVAAMTDGIENAAYTYQSIPANKISRVH